jgi:hypothetical protein
LKSHDPWRPRAVSRQALRMAGSIAVMCIFFSAAPAGADSPIITGESTTRLRMGRTDYEDSKNLFPLYEYLRFTISSRDKNGSTTSLHVGGWLRGDLGDRSFQDRNTNQDLQYGYLSYQGARDNLVVNAGRQFVTEGVASQRLDGLYLRSDLAAGFAAAAFVGSPVKSEPNFKADDFIFGARLSQSMQKYYSIGVSALQSQADSSRYRQEEGVDLWLHPLKQIDITGRSTYNSVTDGWMEHSYLLSYAPLDNLRLFGNFQNINYNDFFFRVTTSALSFQNRLLDPNEEVTKLGGGLAYNPWKALSIAADYTHYDYRIAKGANYYGGKLTLSKPEFLLAGFSVHRMDGDLDSLRYLEYRVFASKSFGKASLTLDFIDLNYDDTLPMNNVKNALVATAAAAYKLKPNLELEADLDYSHSPDFDNEVKAMLKVSYAFDWTRADQGEGKHEK